ncbi:flagellar basal body rod protein FlgB [Actibacterium sp. MT2.3-13A]|uniref:flagellar basal body rod protein FlgB n=1 Tax=Actibacterium sp. MT2.3-13A TaxID=2828332 RepID=UPI001BA4C817|nr:flagellar basal body rod protein FlgB [Actibacterium sp. MT2.3-13A]
MKLDSLSFFKIASQRMQWLSTRQQVISENIANADTPGFRAREVSGFSEMLDDSARPSGVVTTNARHLGGAAQAGNVRVRVDDGAWDQSMDGNTVVLEQQSIKAAEVSENYRMAAQLYRKGHELLTLAVTGIR